MNVRLEKIESLVLVSLIALGFIAMHIGDAAAQNPPLPLLYVMVSGNVADVYLLGEGFTDLDPIWDINGLDITLRFDATAMQAIDVAGDPEGWFAPFWPSGVVKVSLNPEIDNVNGWARMVMFGVPAPGGGHDAPSGQGVVMRVIFDSTITTPMHLEKVPPERAEREPWGTEYFAVDLATFDTGYPVPIVGGPLFGWHFHVSDETPVAGQMITFYPEGYHPDIVALYEWDFTSDGTYDATGPSPMYAYSTPGFHKATLRVTDYLGNVAVRSGRILCNENTLLQNAQAEHKVYDVSADENNYNTLYITARNLGTAAGEVRVVCTAFDKRTGMPIGSTLSNSGIVAAGMRLDLDVNFDPAAFGYEPGTIAGYDVTVSMEYYNDFTGSWTAVDTFKMTFKVVP